jgi:trigger factor
MSKNNKAPKANQPKDFSFTFAEKAACTKTFEVKVSAQAIDRAAALVASSTTDIKVAGYRAGKVPVEYFLKHYAEGFQKTVNDQVTFSIQRKIAKEFAEGGIVNILFDGEVNFVIGSDITVTGTIIFAPQVDVSAYKNIKLDVAKEAVSDEDVAKTVETYKENYAQFVDTTEPADEKCMLKVNYEGDFALAEDAAADLKRQIKAENTYIWLSGYEAIPGSQKALMGATCGEYKFAAEYPADYRIADLAGKTVNYTVTVLNVQKREALTDEAFVEKVKAESIDKVKEEIRTYLENQNEAKYMAECSEKFMEELYKVVPTFDLAEELIAMQKDSLFKSAKAAYENKKKNAKEGETVEDFNEEEALKKAAEDAVKVLRETYIREALVKAENVTCTWEEVQQQAAYYAYQNGIPKESFDKVMKNQNFLESIHQSILTQKAIIAAVEAILG